MFRYAEKASSVTSLTPLSGAFNVLGGQIGADYTPDRHRPVSIVCRWFAELRRALLSSRMTRGHAVGTCSRGNAWLLPTRRARRFGRNGRSLARVSAEAGALRRR